MSLPNELICVKYAQEKQKRINKTKIVITTIKGVLKAVSKYQGIHILAYPDKNRDSELVDGRKAYSQLSTTYIKTSLMKIGELIKRTHDNIIYYNKCEYPEVKKIVEYIEDNYILPSKRDKLIQGQKLSYECKTRG